MPCKVIEFGCGIGNYAIESEMACLFKPLFQIEELKTVTIKGKFATNKAIYAFLRKKTVITSI